MEPLEAELEALDLVFLGSFHPGIVQPAWLARNGLIPDTEANTTNIAVITNEYTQFSTEWFTIEVLPDRLRLQTQLNAFHFSLRDLAAGLLRSFPSSAVTAFGINHAGHFKLDSTTKWNRIGHRMAPKGFWEKILKQPGTLNVTVQGERTDGHRGRIQLTFQPSVRFADAVYLGSNDHFDIDINNAQSSESAADILMQEFESSIQRSTLYFRELITYANSDDEEASDGS